MNSNSPFSISEPYSSICALFCSLFFLSLLYSHSKPRRQAPLFAAAVYKTVHSRLSLAFFFEKHFRHDLEWTVSDGGHEREENRVFNRGPEARPVLVKGDIQERPTLGLHLTARVHVEQQRSEEKLGA